MIVKQEDGVTATATSATHDTRVDEGATFSDTEQQTTPSNFQVSTTTRRDLFDTDVFRL